MRIPILLLCLGIIYGNCDKFDQEETNLIKNADDKDYSNVPLEKSLLRYKRNSLLLPVAKIGLRTLGIGDSGIIPAILDFTNFMNDVLDETENVCPKIEKLSIKTIENVLLYPIRTMQNVLCYVSHIIGKDGRMIARRLLSIFSLLLRRILLPNLHRILNLVAKVPILPPSLRAMIQLFNVLYSFLKLIGYVQE